MSHDYMSVAGFVVSGVRGAIDTRDELGVLWERYVQCSNAMVMNIISGRV